MGGTRWPLALALALLLAGCNRIQAEAVSSRPDLLLVTVDTLRADHVGAYGASAARTPHLDALAAEGVRFEFAIAASPITLPSHATLLTGLQPPHHGVRHNGMYVLDDSAVTLAERFRGAGYSTGAVVGAFVLAGRFGLAQGFEHYDDEATQGTASHGGFLERPASAVTDRALAWLASHATRPQPLFLWVHYYDPHFEYRAPEPFASRFPDHPYDAEIAYVDAELGRLLDRWRAQRPRRDPLVLLTSDHGESLGEHGEQTHSLTLYDAVLRVPLILRGPGVPRGRVVEQVVSGADVAPTLLALAGLSPLDETDGRSLADAWRVAGERPARPAYSETQATRIEYGWSPLYSLRGSRYHYVRSPRPELYDVIEDPHQQRNLVETRPDLAQPLVERLDAQLAGWLAQPTPDRSVGPDDPTRARLEALGYSVPARAPQVTDLDPKDGLRHLADFDRARAALDARDYAQAEALLLRGLEAMPASPRHHRFLAILYLRTNRLESAAAHVEAALRAAPGSPDLLVLEGEIAKARGQATQAAEAFRAALARDPGHAGAHAGLAWEAARAGDLEAADRHARQALASDPLGPELRLQLGAVWQGVGRFDRALEAYRDLVRLAPEHPLGNMLLAIELARSGSPEDARRHRERAGWVASDPWLLIGLARASAEGGDRGGAAALVAELLERRPDYAPALALREELARTAGTP